MPIIVTTADVVVEPPETTPTREVAPLSYLWQGWDGSQWWLTDLGSKVVKVRGATGLGFAPVAHWYSDSPAVPGSSYGGSRVERARLFLPLEVWGDSSTDFLANHRAFAKTLDETKTSRLYVYTPDGKARYAECRYAEGMDAPVDIDPVAACRVRYGITWDRDDPYWLGETVTSSYRSGTGSTFFGAPGAGYVVNVSSSNILETGTVDNPGDVPSSARWVVTGPVTSFSVGVAGATLAMTPNLLAGESITADMSPHGDDPLSIRDQDGNDRYADVTDLQFGDIPTGTDIPLTMSATGNADGFGIELEFTTRYRSAW